MAARRLIAVMLVLLFLSSLAAALAPVEQEADQKSTSTTQGVTAPVPADGKLIRAALDASKRARTIEASVGDQLRLKVTGRRPATVELVRLGATEDLDPVAPARFDVLLLSRGRFPVRELESGRKLGVIEVSAPRARTEPARAPAPAHS